MSKMLLASTAFCWVILVWPTSVNADSPCPDGRSCPDTWLCCEQGCCTPGTTPLSVRREHREHVEYPWYANWPILFLAGTLAGICVCCVWCVCFRSGARQCSCIFACCVRRPTSNHDSAGSCYPPPHYSRCESFHQAPPPYSEVTSKPDLYPLVITCGEGENKNGGNYLMVHYFRNYVIRPGSLSATSTAESLSSSFICNAANEANTIIPPPYSCASNYEEWRGVGCAGSLLRSLSSLTEPRSPRAPPRSCTAPSDPPAPPPVSAVRSVRNSSDMSPDAFRDTLVSPIQPIDSPFDLELELIDYDLCCDSGCRPQLGPSPPVQRSPNNLEDNNVYEHDFERLRHLYSCPCPSPDTIACESPPQPTSPTQTSREALRRPSDERWHKRLDNKKTPKSRKSSLYMPLSTTYPARPTRISPGTKASSRSAPATPCSGLVPNLLALTQRVSSSRHSSKSSRLDEENNPLLAESDVTNNDHKF